MDDAFWVVVGRVEGRRVFGKKGCELALMRTMIDLRRMPKQKHKWRRKRQEYERKRAEIGNRESCPAT